MDIAKLVDVPPATLLAQAEALTETVGPLTNLLQGEGLEAAVAISAIADPATRRQLINLMKALAGESSTEAAEAI